MTNISWTQETWNPIVGCSIVSPGCTNCYAMKMAARLEAMGTVPHYAGTTQKVNGNAIWTGKVSMAPDTILMKPMRRKKPTMYFVNSMGDLFHEDVPDDWIDLVFAIMALCPHHTFQILTKRPERMQDYFNETSRDYRELILSDSIHLAACKIKAKFIDDGCIHGAIPVRIPMPNVWLGVSAEDQQRANERIPILLDTPAALRFVSLEPQLERIDLTNLTVNLPSGQEQWNCLDIQEALDAENETGIDGSVINWVIQGCESGPGARYFNRGWARSIRDQCKVYEAPYFLKQIPWIDGKIIKDTPLLDGMAHQAMPDAVK